MEISGHSIEHSTVFNIGRRILKFVAPEYRVIASSNIDQSDVKIRVDLSLVEVPEGDELRAACLIIYAAGELKLRNTPLFQSAFVENKHSPEQTARMCASVNQKAYRWAVSMAESYFPHIPEKTIKKLVDLRKTEEEWLEILKQ